jgi:hypothetical protein
MNLKQLCQLDINMQNQFNKISLLNIKQIQKISTKEFKDFQVLLYKFKDIQGLEFLVFNFKDIQGLQVLYEPSIQELVADNCFSVAVTIQ